MPGHYLWAICTENVGCLTVISSSALMDKMCMSHHTCTTWQKGWRVPNAYIHVTAPSTLMPTSIVGETTDWFIVKPTECGAGYIFYIPYPSSIHFHSLVPRLFPSLFYRHDFFIYVNLRFEHQRGRAWAALIMCGYWWRLVCRLFLRKQARTGVTTTCKKNEEKAF